MDQEDIKEFKEELNRQANELKVGEKIHTEQNEGSTDV